MKTEKTEGFIFKEEPIDNTEQDENDGEPIQKKRKIENQMIDYQNTIPTLELIQGMFHKIKWFLLGNTSRSHSEAFRRFYIHVTSYMNFIYTHVPKIEHL